MSNYWKKKLDELEKETKAPSVTSTTSYWEKKMDELKNEKKTTVTLPTMKKEKDNDFISTVKRDDEDDIAPVKSKKEESRLDFFQKGVFDDGYQFGDITKTILGTAGDAGLNVVKGIAGLGEGIGDLVSYGIAGVADLAGKDEYAAGVRKRASVNLVDKFSKGAEDYLNQYSILGRTSDAVMQGVGQVGGIIATGGIGSAAGLGAGGVTALTTGTMGLSGMGSGIGEAYQGGATDEEAALYGAISGAADALSELLFGGLGRAINATGFSVGLSSADDLLAKKVSSMFSSHLAKNAAEFGIKAGAEGFEEVIAGTAQAIGKKLTYMSEEDLGKILKDENLLEQFVVGAVTSGIAQAPSLHSANTSKTDFITGQTQNEQAVVKKEIEKRIAEAEKDGKKLTSKEKAKIEAQVEKDMEKGYISTDTIEEVLGGETYQRYKETVDSENALAEQQKALQEEFDTLNKMKQGEMTGEQIDRRAELKEELAKLKETIQSNQNNSNKNLLKQQLSESVSEMVRSDRLIESYNERSRRGQAFEADLSKYDTKQKAVIEKAVNSGILNNTNRTHEFVDMVAKISADKGVLFDFTNNEKLKTSGFAVDGKAVNGYVTKDGITVNIQSSKALNSIVGHEITHVLEGTDLYTELQNAVVEYAKTKGDYQGRYDSLTKLYEGIEGANVDAELTADLVGDYLFTDSDFINNLSVNNRNVFQKIYDEVKYLLKVAAAGSKEARELEKVKRAFEKAYREGGKAQTDTKYALTESFTDSNGTRFDNAVLLDTDFFDGTPPRNWGEKLKEKVNERAANDPFILPIVDENGNTTLLQFARPDDRVTKDGASNHKVLDKLSSTSDNISKLAVIHIDEIVSVSEENLPYHTNENNHQWLDKNGWLHRNANVINQKNGNIYNLTVDIAKAADGRTILYATNGKIKKVGNVQVNSLKIKGSGQNSDFDNKVAQDGSNVKYSISDSNGKQLSGEQQEFFKDSVVRDESGNLKVMYHGTSKGGHTVFDPYGKANYGLFGTGSYFTDSKTIGESYTKKGKGKNPQVYETYLNIKNPIDMDAAADPAAWAKAMPDVQFPESGANEDFFRAMEEYFEDNEYPRWEAAETAMYAIEDMGYDGITHIGGGRVNADGERHQVYIAFYPEQIKNVDNAKPTENPDIRYSLSNAETDKTYLDAVNSGDMDTARKIMEQVAKRRGYTIHAYHGTARGDRVGNVFLPERATSGPMAFFTDNKEIAENYSKSKQDTSMAYDPDYDRYETQFRIKVLDRDIPLYRAWGYLPFDARRRITQKAGQLRENWDGDNELILDPDTNEANGGFQWQLKEARGNAIQALTEQWLNSGNLFNEEARFLDVLEMAGVTEEFKKVNGMGELYFKDPNAKHEKVYDTFLRIRKPFDTATVDEQFIADLEAWYEEQDESKYVRQNMQSDMWDKNGIDAYDFAERLRSDLENNTTHAWTSIPDSVTDYLKHLGYDGIKDTGGKFTLEGHTVWIPFASSQIKSAETVTYDDAGNVIPITERFDRKEVDIRQSLSNADQQQKQYGNYNVYGKDIALETAEEIAPVAENATTTEDSTAVGDEMTPTVSETEKVAPVPEPVSEADMFPDEPTLQAELDSLVQEKETLEGRMMDMANAGDFSEFESVNARYAEVQSRIAELEDEISESESGRLDSIGDEDVPPEMDAPYYEPSKPEATPDPFMGRDMDKVAKDRKAKAYQYENPEVKPFFMDAALGMMGDLNSTTRGEKWYNDELYYESGGEKGWMGTKRHTTEDIAWLKDTYGYTYDQIRDGVNAIIEDDGKENNAVSKRIEFLLHERLVNGYTGVWGEPVPPNQEYINFLKEREINEYSREAFDSFMATADQFAPMEEIAPVAAPVAQNVAPAEVAPVTPKRKKEPKMVRADKPVDQKTASVLVEEPKVEKKKNSLWSMVKENVFDNGMVFEDLALKTKNRGLQAKWNFIRYAQSMAQRMVGNGTENVKSLDSIRKEVEKSGKTKEFYEYLYHWLNVDRMTLENRYEDTPNKAVFGDSVTADMSRVIAVQLGKKNPEFRRWAQDVYRYNSHLRTMMVNNGVISQETADLWQAMYPHYVPIRRVDTKGLNIDVPLDTGRTSVNAPIKRATGGNSDILPLFDTMAQRTLQTYKAIAKNSFGVELKNTLGTTVSKEQTDIDGVIDSVDNHEGLLQEGKNGKKPTFTVFENGEKVTFEITDEMYNAMKPASDLMSYTNPVTNTISNFHRGLLTEYNPVFMATNAIKDTQDILINSQHPVRTYANLPRATWQIAKNGKWFREYMENGGEDNTYFDGENNSFDTEEKGVRKLLGIPPLSWISKINNFVERTPRLAEYIASREAGRSIEVSMLDAARVTTNFAAGGKLTKFLNRNGATFLNASLQGVVQQARNLREAKMNGFKGAVQLIAKFAVAGLPAILLNNLMWDDDDEYEELSDYVKQNYYIVGKYGDGKFVRIPKGRTLAVVQSAFEQMENLITGDDKADLWTFLDILASNLAPNNPIEDNILAPILQAASNTTWYGEDLVPTRLQDLPAAEQFDESTDAISKWLGEKLNFSPYKINYLLDQYSGGVGDTFLPMLTPEAESGDNSFLGNVLAPAKSKFTTDSVINNQNVADFYDTVDKLATNAKSSKATDEDKLMYKYMNSVNAELSDLYAQKREIQNSDLSSAEKYDQVRDIQSQIVALTKKGLATYEDISYEGEYARIGDRMYMKNDEGEWQKLSDEQVTKYEVTNAAGDAPYATDGTNHYRWYEPGEDAGEGAEPGWRKVTEKELERQKEVTSGLGISPEEYWGNREEYSYAFDNPENYAVAKAVGGYDSYKQYSADLYDISADKDKYGKSISGSRKAKVQAYIDSLDADYYTKLILYKSEYTSYDDKNYEIIEYLNGRNDISFEEEIAILRKLGFDVTAEGDISW